MSPPSQTLFLAATSHVAQNIREFTATLSWAMGIVVPLQNISGWELLVRDNPLCGPITHWLDGFRRSELYPETDLLKECFRVLMPVAIQLFGSRRSSYGAEDLVQSSLGSVSLSLARGESGFVRDRDSLWALLLTSLRNKAVGRLRYESRERRGGSRAQADTELDTLPSQEPPPEWRVDLQDSLRYAIAFLSSDQLRAIACLRLMERLSPSEISLRLGCSVPTVYRRINLIKNEWMELPCDQAELGPMLAKMMSM